MSATYQYIYSDGQIAFIDRAPTSYEDKSIRAGNIVVFKYEDNKIYAYDVEKHGWNWIRAMEISPPSASNSNN